MISKTTVTISAALAFLLCLLGGMTTIYSVVGGDEDHIYIGIGLYFIGKAFFVGPSLLVSRSSVE